jgi:hypothetical protein
VAEAAVADEVDHEVVAELRAVGQRQRDGAQRRLGIVGVDVDDRDVEPLARSLEYRVERPRSGRS